jgi:hypothetical protein
MRRLAFATRDLRGDPDDLVGGVGHVLFPFA